MSDDLVSFLRARLDEDYLLAHRFAFVHDAEWDAETLGRLWWYGDSSAPQFRSATDPIIAHCARHDPARVLREVEAKRATLTAWRELAPVADSLMQEQQHGVYAGDGEYTLGAFRALTDVIRRDAAVYSDHPDYPGDAVPLLGDRPDREQWHAGA